MDESERRRQVSLHTQRALRALSSVRDDTLIIERRLKGNGVQAEAADTLGMVRRIVELSGHLATLELLRESAEG